MLLSDSVVRLPIKRIPFVLSLFTAVIFTAPTNAQVGELLWQENFDSLEQNTWTIDIGNGCDQGLCGWGNQELESYQADNVSIGPIDGEPGNNALVLEARREVAGNEQFTSGKILSENKLTVHYGMIEFRMQVPDLDAGYWPAMWMLGANGLPWPRRGEIDLMEMGQSIDQRRDWLLRNENPNDQDDTPPAINNFTGSNLIFFADAACNEFNPTCAASIAFQNDNAYASEAPLAERFVTYRTYWTPETIRFTVQDNGVEHDLYQQPFTISEESAEFREPFYFLMNLAVGGTFTDVAVPGEVTAPDNGKMLVDYIRVYEYNGFGSVELDSDTSVPSDESPSQTVRVEAEDYIAFTDTDVGNNGGAYRSDDVDIETSNDIGGGFNVGWIADGEYLEYAIELSAGTYDVSTRVASPFNSGAYRLLIDGQQSLSDTVDSTGSYQAFETHNLGQITVTESRTYTLRFEVTGSLFNLNWIEFELSSAGTVPNENPVSTENPNSVDLAAILVIINDFLLNSISEESALPTQLIGNITPLFNEGTVLQADTQEDRSDALVTRFSDRPRTRHAREDQFQSYDHYVSFYFEHRSTSIEIIDEVAKGGDTITMNVRTIFPLNIIAAENRWWYTGVNTVAEYAGNDQMEFLGFDGSHYNYRKVDTLNRQFNRPMQIGDRLEFEISQFSRDDIPRGQINYYGTTYLYIVGKGLVPWYTENAGEFVQGRELFQEDSREIPEEYRLGGDTSLHYQYTDEPNDHFMQMATNLGYDNGENFLLGRRVHHSSMIDGLHDENPVNGVLETNVGLTSSHYINQRCTGCHERNGGAAVAEIGESLDRWVFKVGDEQGNPNPNIGRVLQPKNQSGGGEGDVSIASWTTLANGLRQPNYRFEGIQPQTFSARIAPRLVGLGLLEAIDEQTIVNLEDPNDTNGDGISGRANRITDPEDGSIIRLGRFGWKAASTSIKHQTAAALNTDMGVRTRLLPDLDCGSEQKDCRINGQLLDDESFDNLVTYLTGLGVRPQRGWETGVENQSIVRGKEVFSEVGCNSCHVETIQTSANHPFAEVRDQTIHPYTDLLLHDMGEGLADNLGEGNASGSEWRTTPLWGLGLSACVTGGVTNPTGREGDEVCVPEHAYLHDGRARTIDEAVRWHGGEGQASNNAYQALGTNDRNALLEFLNAL